MELLQLVRVRGQRWRVTDIRQHDACQLLTLRNAELRSAGVSRRVLTPFDDVEPIRPRERPLPAGRRAWRRACRALLAANTPPGGLRTAVGARIDLLPHQLEPALAILRGLGPRVLLADDVGLGKTVQASLVVAELLARTAIERVLIVTPAGVRDQWLDELSARFGIDAVLADARTLRERVATLPVGLNPWATFPIALASIDYVKRPEVLPAVQACRWDAIVVDEAHAAAGDSERRAAMRALATRAAYVLLLTATPHNGDERAFAALCDLGRLESSEPEAPLLVFRRTRLEIRGDAIRRIHVLAVRPTAAEERMHTSLARYARAVRDEHGDRALALSVLEKRAFSSAWSLAQSVQRRLRSSELPLPSSESQLALPFDDHDGELAAEDEPPAWPAGLELSDVRRERQLLTSMLEAADASIAAGESKLHALRRLFRRTGEPMVVFTEYRDTALHLQAAFADAASILHGGLARDERTRVLDRFASGADRMLVATDAAGQGLNLHRACRLVINLELPWNPMRLEQRIGRVDRIGQMRPVHACHLVAANTGELQILARLQERVTTAQAAAGAPDPIRASSKRSAPSAASEPLPTDLTCAARAEAVRIAEARRFWDATDRDSLERLESTRPWLMHTRRRRIRAALGSRTLLIFRMASADAAGRIAESGLVPIVVGGNDWDAWRAVPQAVLESWRNTVAAATSPFWTTRLQRERAIAEAAISVGRVLLQGGLFDPHAERDRADRVVDLAEARLESASTLAELTLRASISNRPPELMLVLGP